MISLAASTMSIENHKRLKNGESFLKIKDFFEKIIEPILPVFFGNSDLEKYLLEVLLTFLSLSVEKKIDPGDQIERLLIRLFLRQGNFQVLHQFLQNGIFCDRFSTATVLCELGSA